MTITGITLAEIRIPWILMLAVLGFQWQKHAKPKEIMEATAKALLGYYMVVIGAYAIPTATAPLSKLMQEAFGINGGVMNTEAYSAALLLEFGPTAFAVMFCGFVFNLLLARYTRFKGLYLTGHHYLYMSLFAVMILEVDGRLPGYAVVLLGGAVLGIYGWLSVVTTRRVIEKTTGMSGVGMANSSSGAALIGAFTAWVFGKQANRYKQDERHCLSSMSSIPIGAFVSTLGAYVILSFFTGFEKAEAFFESGRWFENCVFRSLIYGAQIALLLYGIRMMLASVIEMLWDVANRYVKGLWMGVDALVMISYMPRAWGIGFLTSCAGSVLAMTVMIVLKVPFVPFLSPTSLYFAGGVAGICGNAYGGKRGAKLAGLLTGIFVTVMIGVMAANLTAYTHLGIMYGETEYGIYGIILEWISRLVRGI